MIYIGIRSVPHREQRYDTIGDYYDTDSVTITQGENGERVVTPFAGLAITVSELGDDRYEFLVAVHELVESFLCRKRGIAEPDVMAFDKAVLPDSPYADDPGHDPAAPYHKEHVFAECIERLVAAELGVNWQEYEAACDALYPDNEA